FNGREYHGPRRHVRAERLKKWPLAMHLVELLDLCARQSDQFERADAQPCALDAFEDFTGQTAPNGVGLDDRERSFGWHSAIPQAFSHSGRSDPRFSRYFKRWPYQEPASWLRLV